MNPNATPTCQMRRLIALMQRIPHTLIAFVARFSIAAVFWKSGQTKVEGLAIDLVSGTFEPGIPHLADSAVYLFSTEYKVPLLSPEVAAHAAAQLWHCGFRGGTHLCSQGRAGFQIIDQYRAIDGKTFIQKVGIDCARLSFITFFSHLLQVFIQIEFCKRGRLCAQWQCKQ